MASGVTPLAGSTLRPCEGACLVLSTRFRKNIGSAHPTTVQTGKDSLSPATKRYFGQWNIAVPGSLDQFALRNA